MSIESKNSSFDYDQTYSNGKSRQKSQKEGLSSDELKNKLIQVVKNKGIFDSMKSQLRNKLVLELNPNIDQIKTRASSQYEMHKSKSNLALSTINSLFINHLKSNEYDYTLSVFMPESGLNLNDAYSLQDILHILKISPQSKLFDEIQNSPIVKSKGLLWVLINYFCSHYVTIEAGTQTDFDGVHNIASNLDIKLKNVDQLYNNKSESLNNKLSFEDKIVLYQKKLEEKFKLEYNQKIQEFKEIELARMRVEEREKMRLETQAYRQDLENTLSKRNEMLNQREKSLEDLLKQRKELEERELFIQRQHLLDEIKQLREKEADFKRNVESQSKFLSIDASKFEKLEQDLKSREAKLKQAQEELEVRLRDERERIKLDLERSFAQREFILQSIEAKNKQDATQNEIEKAHLDRLKTEFQQQQIRLNEMDLDLQKAQGESVCFKQENELLKEKLSHCMDYDFVVQENRMLKYKLELSKEIIGEKHMSSRRSKSGQSGYVPQRKRSVTFASENEPNLNFNEQQIPLLNLKQSANLDENSIMMATEMGAEQLPKDNLELINEIDYEEKSRASYRDEGERILEDAVERSEIKDKLEHHSVVNEELRDLYEMQIYEQQKLYETINDVKKQVEFIQYGIKADDELLNKPKKSDCKLDNELINPSIEFIDSAKDRLKYLESESERIEQTYRDYQHKIKSKYYPINDDEENEIRIVTKPKQEHEFLDINKFLESTLKANINAKLMKQELENEIIKYKTEKKSEKLPDFSKVEDLIKNVSLKLDTETIREKIEQEENELRTFKNKLNNSISSHEVKLKKNYLDEDSTILELKKEEIKIEKIEEDEDDKTLNSESKTLSTTKNVNNLNDYVNMFNNQQAKNDYKENNNHYEDDFDEISMPRKNSRIKIEYSESSSSSTSPSQARKYTTVKQNKSESHSQEQEEDDFW